MSGFAKVRPAIERLLPRWARMRRHRDGIDVEGVPLAVDLLRKNTLAQQDHPRPGS